MKKYPSQFDGWEIPTIKLVFPIAHPTIIISFDERCETIYSPQFVGGKSPASNSFFQLHISISEIHILLKIIDGRLIDWNWG